MSRGLTAFREVLRGALARLPVGDELASYPVWTDWESLVGPAIAHHAHPRRLRGGVLVVVVDGPDWMHELHFLKDELRARINAHLGRAVVRDVYLILAPER